MKTTDIRTERRGFFKKAGAGMLGAALLSLVPASLFSRSSAANKKQNSTVTVSINPLAVKRTKK